MYFTLELSLLNAVRLVYPWSVQLKSALWGEIFPTEITTIWERIGKVTSFYMVSDISSRFVGKRPADQAEIFRIPRISDIIPIDILKKLAWVTNGPFCTRLHKTNGPSCTIGSIRKVGNAGKKTFSKAFIYFAALMNSWLVKLSIVLGWKALTTLVTRVQKSVGIVNRLDVIPHMCLSIVAKLVA